MISSNVKRDHFSPPLNNVLRLSRPSPGSSELGGGNYIGRRGISPPSDTPLHPRCAWMLSPNALVSGGGVSPLRKAVPDRSPRYRWKETRPQEIRAITCSSAISSVVPCKKLLRSILTCGNLQPIQVDQLMVGKSDFSNTFRTRRTHDFSSPFV